MIRLFSNDPHLRLQPYAKLIKDRILHQVHQIDDILRGSAAFVDDESAVLLRNLGAAYGQALQSGVLNQLSGEIPFRPLEKAAALGYWTGCFSFLRRVSSFIFAAISSWSPGVSFKVTSVTTLPLSSRQLWR